MAESAQRGIFEILKQRFLGPRPVRLAVSLYGKLPFYKDFVRQGLAAREAQQFKIWLDRGFSRYWETSEQYRGQTIPAHGFLFSFPGTGRHLIGYLWGSHDEGKLRSFPFAVFVSLPAGGGAYPALKATSVLAQVVERAETLRRETEGLSEVGSFYRRVRGAGFELTVEPEKALAGELAEALAEVSVEAFAESLYGDDAQQAWPALIAYARRRRAAADGSGAAFAVRLPCSGLLPWRRQVEFWSLFLGRLPGATQARANLICPVEGTDGGLVLLERQLRPDDVFTLHPTMPGYDFVEDLRAAVPGSFADGGPADEADGAAPLGSLVGLGPAE